MFENQRNNGKQKRKSIDLFLKCLKKNENTDSKKA